MPEAVCYQYRCARFPRCSRAVQGCCIEPNPDESVVTEAVCAEENGFALFSELPRSQYKRPGR